MRSALPSAARLEILTMRPKRAARMAGSSACTQRMAAATLTAITACRSALVTASMGAARARRPRGDDVVVDHLQAVGHQARRHGATDATAGAGHEHGAFLGVVGS